MSFSNPQAPLRSPITAAGRLTAIFLLGLLMALPALGDDAKAADDAEPKQRVVIRTTADGKIEVVGADKAENTDAAESDESKDRKAIEAMAQRLWTADAAEKSLETASPQGKSAAAPRRTPGSQAQRLGGLQPRPSAPGTGGGVTTAQTTEATPCLATDEAGSLDPCEIARRIGRLQPCRNADECAAYEAWRERYGAPGLRAAKAKPAPSDDPPKDP